MIHRRNVRRCYIGLLLRKLGCRFNVDLKKWSLIENAGELHASGKRVALEYVYCPSVADHDDNDAGGR